MSVSDYLLFSAKSNDNAQTATASAALPVDFMVLITDRLESPATFLLSHFVQRALRPTAATTSAASRSISARKVSQSVGQSGVDSQSSRKVVFVGFVHPYEHYQSILRKSGLQLASEREAGRFVWIAAPIQPSDDDLRKLYDDIERAASSTDPESGPPVVVLDDVSSLHWSQVPLPAITKFTSSLRSLVRQRKWTLVTLMHADEMDTWQALNDRQLFGTLFSRSDLWLEVTSLETQARGELSVHHGPCLTGWDVTPRSGPNALQFKLEESGAAVHVKGLAREFV